MLINSAFGGVKEKRKRKQKERTQETDSCLWREDGENVQHSELKLQTKQTDETKTKRNEKKRLKMDR